MEMSSIGLPISLMRQNPIRSRSKIVDGISRSIIVELNNVARSNDVKAVKEVVQRGHIFLALLAFLRLETHRLNTGVSWYESKRAIQRSAITLFVTQPMF